MQSFKVLITHLFPMRHFVVMKKWVRIEIDNILYCSDLKHTMKLNCVIGIGLPPPTGRLQKR